MPGTQSCFGAHQPEQVSWEAALEEELARLQCAFLWRAIPWEDLKDISAIGLLVCHGLPCESFTVSWEGKTGTRYWKLHIRQQLHHLSRIQLINIYHTAAEVSCILPPAFSARKNLNRSLGQNQTPDNTLYNDNTRCTSACFLRSPARTAASPAGRFLPGMQRLQVTDPLRRAAVSLFSSPPLSSPFKTGWKIPTRLLKAREQKRHGHRREGLQHPHDAALASKTKRPWITEVFPTRSLSELLFWCRP